jgi:hypothetical protein
VVLKLLLEFADNTRIFRDIKEVTSRKVLDDSTPGLKVVEVCDNAVRVELQDHSTNGPKLCSEHKARSQADTFANVWPPCLCMQHVLHRFDTQS